MNDQTIHTLPESLITQIAAGEVIERPLYVVKELIDNSIDAQATDIAVEIEESGLKRISVKDSGQGMSKLDATLSFLPHTTSKLFSSDDLQSIRTLGFRGEALSSIASVSTLHIYTKRPDDLAGTSLTVSLGKLVKTSSIGMPTGTQVKVDQLFFNVPARKKFLKTAQTEFRLIVDLILRYGLAYPNIRFSLSHNNRPILNLSPQSRTERLKLLLGENIYSEVFPVALDESYLKIEGFVARPHLSTSGNQKQYLFINHRQVQDKIIQSAVKEAFGELLEPMRMPIFVLFLTIPPEVLDINVHPRKEQVKFFNSQFIYDSVFKAIKEALAEQNLTFKNISWKEGIGLTADKRYRTKPSTDTYLGDFLRETALPWEMKSLQNIPKKGEILQLHNLYLITQTDQGLLIIDQHAAHERILYEQLLKTFHQTKQQAPSYILPQPLSIEVTLAEQALLEEYKDYFLKLGFELEQFPNHTLLIRALPELFKDQNLTELVREILDELTEEHQFKTVDSQSDNIIKFLACRAAVKEGDLLSKAQRKNLINMLNQTPNNYTCPHGRPTRIELSLPLLHKAFKRQ